MIGLPMYFLALSGVGKYNSKLINQPLKLGLQVVFTKIGLDRTFKFYANQVLTNHRFSALNSMKWQFV